LVFSISSSEKSDPGKPAAPQKAVVFSLTPGNTTRHTLFRLPTMSMDDHYPPRNWPLFAINLAIKAFSGKHVSEFTILCGHEGSGPLILAKRAFKKPGF
jgi:hypothetical protein